MKYIAPEEELATIPFKCVCTAAWEDEHTITYSALDGRKLRRVKKNRP